MEDRFRQADRLIGIFSDAYCKAAYSQSERWSAYWQDPRGRTGFLVPIEIRKVQEWPAFVAPLKRLSLVDLDEAEALRQLRVFLEPPHGPSEKPAFPGSAHMAQPSSFAGGETLSTQPPAFPASPAVEEMPGSSSAAVSSTVVELDNAIRCIDDHEPKPVVFGRDDEIETIVAALLAGSVAVVAGGPGMGKTAVATAALYDPRIVTRFGRRRVFASLETATESRAILAKLVEALGLPPTGDDVTLMRILETNAADQPLAAILDNAETVFDADRLGAERLLNLVAHLQGLSLAVTIRGVTPPISGAVSVDNLSALATAPARQAFLAVAGPSFEGDPNLPHLLEALDGHALSIRLVAAQAVGLPSLNGLRESWDEAHAEILRRPGEDESRLTSVRASLALSLNCNRMKSIPLARRLLALLAYLPGGLAEADVRSLLGDLAAVTKMRANEAVGCLHQLRLVERRPDLRLRMLTPLRECVKSDVLLLDVDKKRIVDRYLALAARADSIGRREWEKFRDDVEAEADNLDTVCELAIATNMGHRHLEGALVGLTEFHLFSGRGAVGSIDRAARLLRPKPPSRLAATCISRLGRIAGVRSDYETARACYDEALALYRHIGSVQGEANCIQNLGSTAQALSDHETASARYEEALVLCRRLGDMMGEANCIQGLGMIAQERSDNEAAHARFEEALALCRRVGDVLGEANSIRHLGTVAQARSDHETARARYEEALALYRRIGAVMGEASCIGNLGDIARSLSDYKTACVLYEEALVLHRSIGDVQGEAESLVRQGQIRRMTGDEAQGLADIEAGFTLYFSIADSEDRALTGSQAMHRALICGDPNEAKIHREQARSAWRSIGRLDLIRDWVDRAE